MVGTANHFFADAVIGAARAVLVAAGAALLVNDLVLRLAG